MGEAITSSNGNSCVLQESAATGAKVAPEIYSFLERLSPWLVLWSCLFTLVHGMRIARRLHRGVDKVPDNAPLTEIAGLPLTLLQTIAFGMAVFYRDLWSMLLFLWWGPGFVLVMGMVGVARARRVRIDWGPYSFAMSALCKLYYLVYLAVFYVHNMPGMVFVFSVWIINDQYEKAFMSLDADRTRRTFHDRWLFRVLYPLGLLVPLFSPEMPWRLFCAIYGLVLLCLWSVSLLYVWRRGAFFMLPDNPSLLRNMVYFPSLRVVDDGHR